MLTRFQRQRTAIQDTQPREIEPADLLRHYPKGLDYQGRYPEAGHAASEYTDEEDVDSFSPAACALVWLCGSLAAWAGVIALALVLWP